MPAPGRALEGATWSGRTLRLLSQNRRRCGDFARVPAGPWLTVLCYGTASFRVVSGVNFAPSAQNQRAFRSFLENAVFCVETAVCLSFGHEFQTRLEFSGEKSTIFARFWVDWVYIFQMCLLVWQNMSFSRHSRIIESVGILAQKRPKMASFTLKHYGYTFLCRFCDAKFRTFWFDADQMFENRDFCEHKIAKICVP